MSGNLDIHQALEFLAAKLQERPEIVFAYLHGSALERPDFNDLDVTVYVNPAAVAKDKAWTTRWRWALSWKWLCASRSTFAC